MAIRIDPRLCRACGNCVNACPGDLIVLSGGQARLRAAGECWNCLSCAKACPERAIRGVLPFVLADDGASLWPEISGDELRWVCAHPDGTREEFLLGRGD